MHLTCHERELVGARVRVVGEDGRDVIDTIDMLCKDVQPQQVTIKPSPLLHTSHILRVTLNCCSQ